MIRNDNAFALLLTKKGGARFVDTQGNPISAVPVNVDFQPAREDAWFSAVRSGRLDPAEAVDAVIHPLCHANAQNGNGTQRLVSGFRVEIVGGDGRSLAESRFGITYMTADARRLSAVFVKAGQLQSGETFLFKVFAFPAAKKPQPSGRIKIKSLAAADLTIKTDRCLADYVTHAEAYENAADQEYPVVVRRETLERIAGEVRGAGSLETGGSLIMEMRRCPETQCVFGVVTAHLPSQVQGELTRLSYTADTWDVARRAIALRGAEERLAGWYHSHNYLMEACKTCEKRNEGTCNASADFMSDQDLFLQRTIFPQAFTVALVASHSPCSGLKWALFGWNQGTVTRRGFYIVGPRVE